MRIAESFEVASPREAVWKVFLDPVELASCVPGVQDIQLVDPTHYDAEMVVKLPFLTLRFTVHGELTESTENSRLVVGLDGEPASFAGAFRATLTISLDDGPGGGSVIAYEIDMHLTGRLASLGEALMRSTASNLGRAFAQNVKARLAAA